MELPYEARAGQTALLRAIEDTQSQGRHAVLESPTGTGKTIAALVASLRSHATDGRRILYATRTNSQQTQVMAEHRALRRAGEDPGLLVPLMGRRHHCPLLATDDRFKDGTAEELGRLCKDAKRRAVQALETGQPVKGSCPYYERFLQDGTAPVEALLRSATDGENLGAQVAKAGSCAHEALKELLPHADVVVMPLIYLIDDRLRNALSTWLGSGLDDWHIVIDEAHHVPDAARSHHSVRLGQTSIARAVKEAEKVNDPVLAGRVLTTSFLYALQRTMQDIADEYILPESEDARVPAGALEERLMEELRMPSTSIERLAIDLETWGDIVRDEQQSKGRLPRSYLGAIGNFIRMWMLTKDAPYAHLVEAEPMALEAFLLEPSGVLGWLHEAGSTTQMSGTLSPPEDHARMVGLPADTTVRTFPSPFRPEQLRTIGLEGVHRRWKEHRDDPHLATKLQDTAHRVLSACSGRTALWFPSHAMLSDYVEEGFLHGIGRPVHFETPDMTLPELERMLVHFQGAEDGILLGVLGGRLTEGIDYPGDLLQFELILGIPYPRPSARLNALIHHQNMVHDGQGWNLAVHNPVGRVLRQAVGRLVRGPDDYGTAYVLDERIVRFHSFLPDLVMVDSDGPLDSIPLPQEGFIRGDDLQP